MKKDDKNNVKKGLEKPSPDFTKNIMQKIDAEEVAIGNVLSKHSLESPSTSFTDSIMANIEVRQLTPYKPVISKYVWYGLAATFIGLIIFTFANTTVTNQTKLGSRLDNITETFQSVFTGVPYLSYSAMAILGISVLLLLDQKFKKQRIS